MCLVVFHSLWDTILFLYNDYLGRSQESLPNDFKWEIIMAYYNHLSEPCQLGSFYLFGHGNTHMSERAILVVVITLSTTLYLKINKILYKNKTKQKRKIKN